MLGWLVVLLNPTATPLPAAEAMPQALAGLSKEEEEEG
jgi:hypothetical protein